MTGNAKWLTPTSGYLQGYSHTLNPYVGCSFGCSYCYVRRMPVGLFRGQPWGSWAEPRKADPSKFRVELARANQKGPVTVFFSSATDPYQPLEATLGVTRALLEAMADEPPAFVLLQTRSALVTRDIDVLQRLKGKLRVSMTVETDLEEVRRELTPSAPPLASRWSALRRLREAGIDIQAAVSPILPHSADFAERLAEAVPRVVVDDYFRGDGSGGKRSAALDLKSRYEKNGWISWYDPSVAEHLVAKLRSMMGEASVGFSADGFAPPRAVLRPYLTEADNGLNTGLKADET
ncbi:radical SAM protein [Cohnella endophytica]|uniref:Radical SAM protein n=1 Tax=Cohnella endophytica TaxID=2419778 RepID=A0A494XZA9_9BACL|nr:radical SAM protein [Cohnella endophytica]RKP55309.1 radical SAM protein [Cohnella endophytica]